MMIGLALQNLQVFAHPEIDHTIQEKYAEEAEEDGEGDPENAQKILQRQLRRIRNGEAVDRLQVPLPVPEHETRAAQSIWRDD